MKFNLLKISTLILAVFVASCSSPSETTTPSSPVLNMDRQASSIVETPVEAMAQKTDELHWEIIGSYEGMLPCADCEGMFVHLVLTESGEYTLSVKYVGKDFRPEPQTGKYTYSGDIVTLIGVADQPNKYTRDQKGELIQLDFNGNRITGSLADQYILNKTN